MRDLRQQQSLDFFAGIEQEKAQFLARARRCALGKNDIVFFEGDPGGACFYVESGLVRIFSITDCGKEPIYFLRRPGEMFGLSEVLDAHPRKANAQTLAPTVLHRMDAGAFDALLAESYPLARRVIAMLGYRVRYLGDQISGLMTCNVMHRLVKLLISLIYDQIPDAAAWERPVVVPVRISQGQIAAMTGSTQPTISDLLQQLQREGLLQISRRHILVLRPLQLLRKAEETALV